MATRLEEKVSYVSDINIMLFRYVTDIKMTIHF